MNRILRMALLAVACMAIGVGLACIRVYFDRSAPHALQLMRSGDAVVVLLPIVWAICTLMIGQALPRQRRPAMISGMGRSDRVTLTAELRNRVTAAYIGDARPSIREVARQVGCSYGTVHRIVTEAGVVRARGITNRSLSRTRRQAVNA
jgi:AraC-like DNA-binding protein